jgi:hypothetical protein
MSRTTLSAAVMRPTVSDYLLLLAGAGLSLYLMDLSPFAVEANDNIGNPSLRVAITFLPRLLRLPEGIILLLPLFVGPQFLLGRREGLTAAEWLWLFSWCGTALLTAFGAADFLSLLPALVRANLLWTRFVWYVGFDLAMAGVAVALLVIGLFRPARPWTHQLGLALAFWPVPPLAGIMTLTKLFN